MSGENAKQMGCYSVDVPDWLLAELLAEPNLGVIASSKLNQWAIDHILPVAQLVTGREDLWLCANHVHIGDVGVKPHDHLPHEFTSVVFLTDSLGELVMNMPDGSENVIIPEEGKMIIFPASWIHYVRPSPEPELRVTFVSNYEFQTV